MNYRTCPVFGGHYRCYTCPGADDHNHRYDNSWVFVGETIGTQHFDFPGNFIDIAITWGDYPRWNFDAIIGDNGAGYGYTVDGQFSASYLDSSNFEFDEVLYYEHRHEPMPHAWGIVGPVPDGSCSQTWGRGFILFRMLSLPWDQLWASSKPPNQVSIGDFPYELSGITVYVEQVK